MFLQVLFIWWADGALLQDTRLSSRWEVPGSPKLGLAYLFLEPVWEYT